MVGSKKQIEQPFVSGLLCRQVVQNGIVARQSSGWSGLWGGPKMTDFSHLGPMQAAAAMLESMITMPGPRCIGIKKAIMATIFKFKRSILSADQARGPTCKRKQNASQENGQQCSKQPRNAFSADRLLPYKYSQNGKSFMDLPEWFQKWMLKFMPEIGKSENVSRVYYKEPHLLSANIGLEHSDKKKWYIQV
jgi:hypothetical protein